MTPWSLLDLDRTLRASWAADTCSPDDRAEWRPDNPAAANISNAVWTLHSSYPRWKR